MLESLTYAFLLLISLLLVLWIVDHLNIVLRGQAPLVRTPACVLSTIDDVLEIGEGDVVYDLGCGDGRVLNYLAACHPRALFIGVDRLHSCILVAKLKAKLLGLKNVKYIRGNLYSKNVSDASKISLWIYPSMLPALQTKFENELTDGVKVISMDFPIKGKSHDKEVTTGYEASNIARRLFIYTF